MAVAELVCVGLRAQREAIVSSGLSYNKFHFVPFIPLQLAYLYIYSNFGYAIAAMFVLYIAKQN